MSSEPSLRVTPCANPISVSAIPVVAGHLLRGFSGEVSKYSRTNIWAADPDFGLLGYIVAGGHSQISAKYGQAADNMLETSLMTPTGDIFVANDSESRFFRTR